MMHRDVQAQGMQGRTAAVVHIRLKCTLVAEKTIFLQKNYTTKIEKKHAIYWKFFCGKCLWIR